MGKFFGILGCVSLAVLIILLLWTGFSHVNARDLGQWENNDAVTKQWYQSLMQPDNPSVSCCGEGDAYWADDVHVRDGKTYVTVTDDRDDMKLGRQHIDIGTVIEVPNNKLTYKDGNPTGHNILFVMYTSRYVLCFVQGTGI